MIYTIKQGKHYSTHWVGMLWRAITGWTSFPRIRARVTFCDNCLTPSKGPDDINKLFGLSSGWDHHQNSARVGWRAKGDKVELLTYVYKQGKRYYEPICEVSPFVETFIDLIQTKAGWEFMVSGYSPYAGHKKVAAFNAFPLTYKKLYPYFGGDNPAPETMKIKIEWL